MIIKFDYESISVLIKNQDQNMACENNCSVCLEQMTSSVKTECNHEFCEECIDDWFNHGQVTCPLCRAQIKYIFSKGEKVRVVVRDGDNVIPPGDNLVHRHHLLRRWILVQWLAILSLAMILFILLSINEEQNKNIDEILDSLDTIHEEQNECLLKTSDLVTTSILSPRRDDYHWRQCSIPKYYLDLCL